MIPMNDFIREYAALKPEIDEAIQRVLKSGWYILGKEVENFEKECADYLGVPYAIATGNGFDSLQIILKALDIGNGDEVITTPNTAFATTLAIIQVGAVPVYVDIDSASYSMDPTLIEQAITPNTKAILPVHIYGNMQHNEAYRDIAKQHHIYYIEDACQSFGAISNSVQAGCTGIAAAFSFYPTKNLGCFGDGGLITTPSKSLYEKILPLRNYGQSKRYYHTKIGINSRLDEMQAAILRVKLKHINSFITKRIEIATQYEQHICNPKITKPVFHNDGTHSFHLYVLRCAQREKIMHQLQAAGITSLIHYPVPMHQQEALESVPYKKLKPLTNTEDFAKEFLSIPIHPFMTDAEVQQVIIAINAL